MITKTRFGTQPAHTIIRQRYRSIEGVARLLGVSKTHLYNVVTGRVRPNVIVERRLPVFLGMSFEELFTSEIVEGRKTCSCECACSEHNDKWWRPMPELGRRATVSEI